MRSRGGLVAALVSVASSVGVGAAEPWLRPDFRSRPQIQVVGEGGVVVKTAERLQFSEGARLPGEPSLSPAPSPDDAGTERFRVMLDPGHGGAEEGCHGTVGTREKDLVFAISGRILSKLTELPGIEVSQTRRDDEQVPLWDRVDLANEIGADLFISIHANSFPHRKYGGVETFFHSLTASDAEASRVAQTENLTGPDETGPGLDPLTTILDDMRAAETLRDSSRFAHLVQLELKGVLPFPNLGVRQADFVVLRGTRMPSVLLEIGFLTNPREEKVLRDAATAERIAEAVRIAVVQFRELVARKRVNSGSGPDTERGHSPTPNPLQKSSRPGDSPRL